MALLASTVIVVCGLPMFSAHAAPAPYAATASLAPAVRYLDDTAGSVYRFTVRNTGTTAWIGGVEIKRPTADWAITACPTPPAGWTATATSRTCRFRSAAGPADDLKPGQSRVLKVKATTRSAPTDVVGEWSVTVSRTNQFDSQLKAATAAGTTGLQQTLNSFQVTSAGVSTEAVAPGDACTEPPNQIARTGSIRTIVVCGRNRANATAAPTDDHSSLEGSFVQAEGSFASGPIPPGSGAVVLGVWTGTKIVGAEASGYKVKPVIGTADMSSPSPGRALKGFTASSVDGNAAPSAEATSASGNEDGGAVTVVLTGHDDDGEEVTFDVSPASNGVVPDPVPGQEICDDRIPSTCTQAVTYTPEPEFSGSDSFTYTATDGTDVSAPATSSMTITGVNDAPSFTKGADQTVLEGGGAQTVEGWASEISAGPADESSQDLDFLVTTEDDRLFASLPQINGNGDLAYTPAADLHGTATLAVTLTDDGGTANGGDDTSAQQSFTIDVLPDNAAPTAMATSAAGDEDGGAITVTLTGHDDDGDALTFDVGTATKGLVTVPTTVTCDGLTPSTCSTTVTYTPNPSSGGADSFTYAVDDGKDRSAPATASISVRGVNDAPSFTHKEVPAVLEDSGVQAVTGFVTSTDPGAPDESDQNVVVVVVGTDDDGMFSTPPTIDDAGTLNYTPAPNANGTATVTAQAWDDGGIENGGDSIGEVTFTVTVTPVNDEPSFTVGNNRILDEDSGAQSVSPWAAAISKGPGDESAQSLSFTTTNDNNGLFAVQPGLTPTGTLVFTSAPNRSGTATVTVWLSDDGGTANGGDDTSPVQTFTITVTPVNDAPVAAAKSFTVQANMKVSLGGLLVGASDPNDVAGDPSWSPSFTVGSVTPGASCIGCTVSNVNATNGTFDFDPPAGGSGTYSVTYTVRDSGSPGPGALSAPQTITFTVNGPVIWFVDADAPFNGTGRLSAPFNTLESATTAMGTSTNHRIFVEDGNVTGNVTLQNDGWLVSDAATGASFDAVMGITPPAGTIARPTVSSGSQRTLTGTVTLGTNSVVRGFDLTPTSGSKGLVATAKIGLTVNQMSITTTSARAVDLASSSGVFELKRVTATGADRGISLASTNVSTGSFTVSGTGSAGSGGVISDSTALGTFEAPEGGVYLSDSKNVTLKWMTISSNDANGVYGKNVTDLALQDSTMPDNGTTARPDYSGIRFDNLLGTSSIDRVNVSGSRRYGAWINNTSGTGAVSVAHSTFSNNPAVSGTTGLLVESTGGMVTFSSTANSVSGHTGSGMLASSRGGQQMDVNVTGGTYTANDYGLQLDGDMKFAVVGGTVTGCATCHVPVSVTATNSTRLMTGTITGMTITNNNFNAPAGIQVRSSGRTGNLRMAITDNSISQVLQRGIEVLVGGTQGGAKAADLKITGNTIDQSSQNTFGDTNGIYVSSGTTAGDVVDLCADISGNTVINRVAPDVKVVNNYSTTSFRLPGYTGTAMDAAAVQSFLLAQNAAVDATATIGSGAPGFGGGAACAAP